MNIFEKYHFYNHFVLQVYLPPTVMLPPRRLSTLLDQAARHQRDNCVYHNMSTEDSPPDTYAMDHLCTKEMFPCETIQVLMDHGDEVWYCKWSPNGRYAKQVSSWNKFLIYYYL